MENQQLVLLANLSPGDDHALLERIQACINHRNFHGSIPTKALGKYSASDVVQVVVGPDHIAFLFSDHRVGRLSFDVVEVKLPAPLTATEKSTTTSTNTGSSNSQNAGAPNADNSAGTSNANNQAAGSAPPGSGNAASFSQAAAASAVSNRTAKIRRVMMASRRGQFANRTGVIVDRSRAMIPASSIPEDLIAQAQVVLQGKSREVIVRELQRTNLNVNEAVNNLLSREDDEEDLEEAGEAYLPEELLSLLDAGLRSSEGIMEQESLYAGEGYEYLMSRELSTIRRRENRSDASRRERAATDSANNVKEKFVFGDSITYWCGDDVKQFPPGVKRFIHIAAFQGELLALTDNGQIFGWSWDRERTGDLTPHPINAAFLGNSTSEHFVKLETSSYRAVVQTNKNRFGTFMDARALGQKVAETLFVPLVTIPEEPIDIKSIQVCPMFAAIRTSHSVYWWGVNPFNERRRLFEKLKSKAKKYQTSTADIKIGAEVRTKSSPVYAVNSVAVNLHSPTPMIGVLMESAWSLTETCRFRIYTPEQFDKLDSYKPKDKKSAINLSVRKRAAPSDEQQTGSSSSLPVKETAWAIKDVFFIHEEPCNEIGIVQIVDGSICGVHFKSYLDEKKKTGDGSSDLARLRLIRKDELIAVHGSGRLPSAPITFERCPQRVYLPDGIKRVVSMVVDNTGFRMLVEKRGHIHLLRMSTLGKLASDHQLPVSPSAVLARSIESDPKLLNYGDDNVLMLRDRNGSLIPLARNAAGGFSEPSFLGMTSVSDLSVGIRYLRSSNEFASSFIASAPLDKVSKNDGSRAGFKLVLVAALLAPSRPSIAPPMVSLMQLILYSDVEGVRQFFVELADAKTKLSDRKFDALIRECICDLRSDGNRTVLHTAVMNSFSKTNALQADVEPSENSTGQSLQMLKAGLDTSEADAHREKMDIQWQNMIAGAISESAKQLAKSTNANDESKAGSEASRDADNEQMDTSEMDPAGTPVADPKIRQKNAIEILRIITECELLNRHIDFLFNERDILGHTPFNSAVLNRAYGAASVIWNAMRKHYSDMKMEEFTKIVYDNAVHSDDSPLFVLCYNDTCSFTWTGDEHINQDIFECKTCGLTGSLCCCTECANTCHRNHDCKLKRTSPTAYCDCWEKCGCKALVSGNDTKREFLLHELLDYTTLISQTNWKSEHLLLFLARTVGRQLIEQENYHRRSRNRAPGTSINPNQEVPERDLEPPKFAQRAFRVCLSEWRAVKSLIAIGLKNPNESAIVSEEIFHLNSQNGSTHLDKFVFFLLAKCQESHLDTLLDTLITTANKKGDERDPDVDILISRFVRSVARIFSLITLVAPSTIALTVNSVACHVDDDSAVKFSTSTGESTRPQPTRAIAISGVLSLVRNIPMLNSDRSSKEQKKKNVNAFALRCRRVFQALTTYSVAELLNMADAYMGPVRTGFINPSLNIARAMHSSDPLDYIERFFVTEQDLSSAIDSNGDRRACRRRRYGSRRENEDETTVDAGRTAAPHTGSDDSDSDSDNEADSRRFSSQGSLHGHLGENLSAVISTYRRTGDAPPPAVSNGAPAGNVNRRIAPASDEGDSDDSGDDDESEADRGFGIDGFNNEEFDDDEEIRENDDEEDDYYDDDADEEGQHEFAEDGDGSVNEDEGDYENDEEAVAAIPAVEISVDNPPEPAEPPLAEPEQHEADAPAAEEAMAVDVSMPINQAEDVVIRDNDEVAVDIAPNDGAEVAVAPEAEPNRSRNRVRATAPQHFASSRSLTWAVPSFGASNSASERRDENNSGELMIRTNNANNAEATEQSNRAKIASVMEDSSASSEKTAFQFAALFSSLIRLVDDLMLQLTNYGSYSEKGQTGLPVTLAIERDDIHLLRQLLDDKLEGTWVWLTIILDKVESQLRFGNALNSSPAATLLQHESDRASAEYRRASEDKQRKYKSKSDNTSSSSLPKKDHQHGRRDFIQYFLAMSRSHANENGDELPIIEYRALRAAAFAAEAFLFHASVAELIDHRLDSRLTTTSSTKEKRRSHKREKAEAPTVPPKLLRKFFQRSNAVCYPCISFADPHHAFRYCAEECLPLSIRSSLLQPDVDKDQLFNLPCPQRTRSEHITTAKMHGIADPTFQSLADYPAPFGKLKDRSEGDVKSEPAKEILFTYLGSSEVPRDPKKVTVDEIFAAESSASRMPVQRLLGRWSNVFSLVTQMCTDDLIIYCGGDAAYSMILVETAGFHFRQSQFRRRIEKLKNSQLKDLVFSGVVREPAPLVVQTFRLLNQQYSRRTSSTNGSNSGIGGIAALRLLARGALDASTSAAPPPLASQKVKVTFKDEPGEGTGVARSFYSAVADALMNMRRMPMDGFEPVDEDKAKRSASAAQLSACGDSTTSREDAPFFTRLENGHFVPVPSTCSETRLNGFRNIGRMIGICLQQREIFPIQFGRHVLKYFLNQPLTWFDLAFYDTSLFDSMRSLVYDEETGQPHGDAFYESLGMTFVISFSEKEGGATMELKEQGDTKPVTRDNILEYLYLFVEKRLYGPAVPVLDAMRQGLFDVIPADSLNNLTPEDLRLILCGSLDINMGLLESYTKFLDESSSSTEVLDKYKQTFWSVVNKLTDQEKQDLIFFWTGSPTLPATEEEFQPLPTIMIRPSDNNLHLPTANTCISRLYLPLYSSKKILRSKLLLAIKARNFGFV